MRLLRLLDRRSPDPDDPRLRAVFCRAFLRVNDGEAAARRAGAGRGSAPALARRLLAEEAIWQQIEDLRSAERYADRERYRPPPAPLCGALYHCCAQKTASQWLKAVFQDPSFFRATGLRVQPFVQLGHRLARLPDVPPRGTLVAHLYVDRHSFEALPKPADHRWFFVQRDPRDALVSWYHSALSSHIAVDPIPTLRAHLQGLDLAAGLGFLIERLAAWGYFESLASWCAVPLGRGRFRYEDLAGDERSFLMLPDLLKKLCKINGFIWIRILYCYPEEITDELIQVIKEEKKICNYLDLPIQHASNKILKRMGRRTSQEELRAIVKKLRKEIPDICLRTTLITGFPGETTDDQEEVIRFVDELEFDRLGVFTYSPEEGTKAEAFADQVDEEIKKDRQAEIMELQQEIAFEKAENMIGRELYVFIEGKVADENAYVSRTYKDAPNVDGFLFVNTDLELMTGDFVKVRVTGAYEYDLIGEIIE
jgi:hypothetical protein